MIFKLIFSDKTEYAQAKSQLHLLQEWNNEYDDFEDIQEVIEVSEEEAKTIMLSNNEYNDELPESDENFKEFSLLDASCGEDFCIIGSTEWD
jgi:uncharacterized protein YqhQ